MTALETEIQHMPGCRCLDYFGYLGVDELGPAVMVDDRHWEANGPGEEDVTGLAGPSLSWALREAAGAGGVPFLRISESRWNEKGESIGPRLETRICEMVEYRLLRRQVSELIEETVQRMKAAR